MPVPHAARLPKIRCAPRLAAAPSAPTPAHPPRVPPGWPGLRLAQSDGGSACSLDDLGGLEQHVLGDGEAESLGGLEVDDEVEGRRLLHGEVGGLGAFQNTVYIVGSAPMHGGQARAV